MTDLSGGRVYFDGHIYDANGSDRDHREPAKHIRYDDADERKQDEDARDGEEGLLAGAFLGRVRVLRRGDLGFDG